MKLPYPLILLLVLTISFSYAQKKAPKIPDTYFFQETLLKSLAENDESIFLTLAPTRNDMDTALKYIDEPKNVSSKGVDSMFLLIQEKAGDNFKSLQKFASVNKIDWTMIAEDSVVTTPKKKFEKDFPSLRYRFYFTSLGEHYLLYASQLLCINNHWVLSNNVRLKKISEVEEAKKD
jgi:hypothetical protein